MAQHTTTPSTTTPTTAPVSGSSIAHGNPKLLRSVLRENAMFSWLSGGFLAVGGAAIDEWLGLNQWIIIAAGIGLLGYGAMIWQGASRDETLKVTGQTAVLGDIGWIVGAIVIVAATSWLTTNGERALLLISVPVLLFAIGQEIGLKRLNQAPAN